MRPRTATVVWAASLVLGGATGLLVAPLAGSATPTASPSPSVPSAASPTPSAAAASSPTSSATAGTSPSPEPSPSPTKRLGESDLLSVQSFADESVSVTSFPQDGKVDVAADATLCVSDDVHAGARTLREITGHDPQLQGYWTEEGSGYATGQVLSVADDAAGARKSVADLVAAQQPCLEAASGHWVLGPGTTEDFSSTRSATWFGYFPAEQNTSGRAPDDVEPCGGTVLARNGARFTVVNVRMCFDATQLAGLAAAASERLG